MGVPTAGPHPRHEALGPNASKLQGTSPWGLSGSSPAQIDGNDAERTKKRSPGTVQGRSHFLPKVPLYVRAVPPLLQVSKNHSFKLAKAYLGVVLASLGAEPHYLRASARLK